jgi:tetratricopeptide (TPR) repeat protein
MTDAFSRNVLIGLLALAATGGPLLLPSPAAAQTQSYSQAESRSGVAGASPEAAGERSPEIKRQLRRARTAWRTESSLLEAKARLDRILRALPTDTEVRTLRARVLLKMGRPAEAFDDAMRAADLAPKNGEAHLLRAEAARELSHFEAARRALDAAADHLPAEDAALHARLSWNALLLDRLDQAEAFGRVALQLDSTSAPAHRQLARVFLQRERADEAAAVLARGLRSDVLRPRALREDELLRRLIDHPRLRDVMK